MYELRTIRTFCTHHVLTNASDNASGGLTHQLPLPLKSAVRASAAAAASTPIDLKSYSIYGFRQLPGTLASVWRTLPAHSGVPIDVGLYPLLYWLVLAMSLGSLVSVAPNICVDA